MDILNFPDIDLPDQLDTLRRVSAQFCFDIVCPLCGAELCEGERHECRLVSGPLELPEQAEGYRPGHD